MYKMQTNPVSTIEDMHFCDSTFPQISLTWHVNVTRYMPVLYICTVMKGISEMTY